MPAKCPDCRGTGLTGQTIPCEVCLGAGGECSGCGGLGEVDELCLTCNGSGRAK